MDFGNTEAKPIITPLVGFVWKFMSGIWAIFPESVQGPLNSEYRSRARSEEVGEKNLFVKKDSPDDDFELDDSMTEFEQNLRELMPGLRKESSSVHMEKPKGTRKSKRQKKPSSKWNEDDGFLAEPLKSAKKIGTGRHREGISSKLLLVSNWSNVQILNYYNTCGISFFETDSYLNECISHIC